MIERLYEDDRLNEPQKEMLRDGVGIINSVLEVSNEKQDAFSGFYPKMNVRDFIRAIESLEDDLVFDNTMVEEWDMDYRDELRNSLREGIRLICGALEGTDLEDEKLDCFCRNMTAYQLSYAMDWHIGQAC